MDIAPIHAQIEELALRLMHLDGEASEQCARGVFTMTKLRALALDEMTLDDKFFSVMSNSASQSQVDLSLLSPASNIFKYMHKTSNGGNTFGTLIGMESH